MLVRQRRGAEVDWVAGGLGTHVGRRWEKRGATYYRGGPDRGGSRELSSIK